MKLEDALRIGIDTAGDVVRGQDYGRELVDRVDRTFACDGGTVLRQWQLCAGGLTASVMLATSRPVTMTAAQISRAQSAAGRHPSFSTMVAGPVAQRVSDVADMPRFWESDVYRAMHAPTEGRYPAALVLQRTPTSLTFLGLHRQVRDLADDELECLAALGEPLRAALAFRAALDGAVARLDRSPCAPDERFTRREAEAIVLASRGWTTHRIAHHLGISESAVKLRLSSARDRVGASSRTELVARWSRSAS